MSPRVVFSYFTTCKTIFQMGFQSNQRSILFCLRIPKKMSVFNIMLEDKKSTREFPLQSLLLFCNGCLLIQFCRLKSRESIWENIYCYLIPFQKLVAINQELWYRHFLKPANVNSWLRTCHITALVKHWCHWCDVTLLFSFLLVPWSG